MRKIEAKCDFCGKFRRIQEKSYVTNRNRHGGKSICRKCAAKYRSARPEYIEKIRRGGKDHWAFGLQKELHPNYGVPHTKERIQKIRESKQRILPSGLTVAQASAIKTAQTRRRNGSYRAAVLKAAITKEKNNSWVNYRTKHYKGFYYRSSLELRFLKEWEEKFGNLGDLSNCDFSITYLWENVEHHYIPDFFHQRLQTLYEVKSGWTWDGKGENEDLKRLNKCKLQAAHSDGYDVQLFIYRQCRNGKYADAEIYMNGEIELL